MKTRFITLVLSITVIILSCEKQEFKRDISGTWKAGMIVGGIAGTWVPMNFTELKIKKNYHYFIYSHDTLKASGEYYMIKTDDDFFHPYALYFKSPDNTSLTFPFNRNLKMNISRNDDSLSFSEKVFDGFEYYFIKQ